MRCTKDRFVHISSKEFLCTVVSIFKQGVCESGQTSKKAVPFIIKLKTSRIYIRQLTVTLPQSVTFFVINLEPIELENQEWA